MTAASTLPAAVHETGRWRVEERVTIAGEMLLRVPDRFESLLAAMAGSVAALIGLPRHAEVVRPAPELHVEHDRRADYQHDVQGDEISCYQQFFATVKAADPEPATSP
jgi:hypothetical protein